MAAGCGLLTAALQAAVVAAAASAALLLVGVGVLVVLHACTVAKAVSAAAAPATRGLSPRELSRMPSYTASGGGGGDDVDCAVCLEGFRAGEVCRLLPACGHSFHAQCVDSWLLMMPVCPMCRNGVGGGGGGGPTLQQGRSSSASASSE